MVIAIGRGFPRHIDLVFGAIHRRQESPSVAVSKCASTRDFHRNNEGQAASIRPKTFARVWRTGEKKLSEDGPREGTPHGGEFNFTKSVRCRRRLAIRRLFEFVGQQSNHLLEAVIALHF